MAKRNRDNAGDRENFLVRNIDEAEGMVREARERESAIPGPKPA